jgi:hypothetical protein
MNKRTPGNPHTLIISPADPAVLETRETVIRVRVGVRVSAAVNLTICLIVNPYL